MDSELKPLDPLEPQEAFSLMVIHLRKQGRKSRKSEGSAGMLNCQFRGTGGSACAVGCLIPDDRYSPGLEGQPFRGMVLFRGWPGSTIEVMGQMMLIHDSRSVVGWEAAMTGLAERRGFTMPPLEASDGQ